MPRKRTPLPPPPVRSALKFPHAAALGVLASSRALPGEANTLEEKLEAVLRIHTIVPADARTADTLGREREGTGVVIDRNGLVLTIGYLMIEAVEAEIITNNGRRIPAAIVGYDHETGFGLLRAIDPIRVRPMVIGNSAKVKGRDAVTVASFGGPRMAAPAFVVSKREFAGAWEYLLDEAIFTAPPHPAWSGAALLDRDGRLLGVGSLIVGDAAGANARFPGNMFVPIDRLPPILGDLIMDGRASGPGHPWMGVSTDEIDGKLMVSRVTPDGPGEKAGLQQGDVIAGLGGAPLKDLADFYRKIWALGPAGAVVSLDVVQGMQLRRLDVRSIHRLDHLKKSWSTPSGG